MRLLDCAVHAGLLLALIAVYSLAWRYGLCPGERCWACRLGRWWHQP